MDQSSSLSFPTSHFYSLPSSPDRQDENENQDGQCPMDSDEESVGSLCTTTTWSALEPSTPQKGRCSSSCTTPDTSPNKSISPSQPAPSTTMTPASTEPKPAFYVPDLRDTCFQCAHLGLRCSFTSIHQRRTPAGPAPKGRWCSRCVRNGEPFCILQNAVRKEGHYLDEVRYEADGIARLTVLSRVRQLKAEKAEKYKWTLPAPKKWSRAFLRRVYPPLSERNSEPKSREEKNNGKVDGRRVVKTRPA
ncbi:hypothetical protein PVAG01_00600 [Phlyctema vagabunda]|uniref:Zn(2)-C6 fungal-type domain-containing protein n=1 Tax=Phlyctema vagabunda TaxID=108571 RepID=A0ABR4PV17_9HELO